eukprot:CAMPEP_0172465060 /NCGR_PEP_ID=MMETSP1065-20121228/52362_1 /TAXON_ID=265537 /ORGANISM="Amphiprora paludosa, Strain CCMP125" /LENGTH=128 /DNA_ID=CAMNT_0013221479 /DNA_START=112 /DNA_END=495 /DNA_ORIENTATION=-
MIHHAEPTIVAANPTTIDHEANSSGSDSESSTVDVGVGEPEKTSATSSNPPRKSASTSNLLTPTHEGNRGKLGLGKLMLPDDRSETRPHCKDDDDEHSFYEEVIQDDQSNRGMISLVRLGGSSAHSLA